MSCCGRGWRRRRPSASRCWSGCSATSTAPAEVGDDGKKGDGQIALETRFVSLDPAMRGWMAEGKFYLPPVWRDRRDGGRQRLLVLPPCVLDPETGALEPVALAYSGDFFSLSWNGRGELVAGGFQLRTGIWRFRPDR